MRIAVAQINPTLGEFSKNRTKILEYILRAKEKHCELVIFPEASLYGYHPFDLLERKKLVQHQLKELKQLEKDIPSGIAALVGVFTFNPSKKGRPYFNSAALIERGKKTKFFHKELLPTGDVFDEARFIEPGKLKDNFFRLNGKQYLVTICEDIWAWPDNKGRSSYLKNPLNFLGGKKVDCILNMSASPFYLGKETVRLDLVKKTAAALKAPMIYCNLVGAQDEVIFDGASFAVSKTGKVLANCAQFTEDLNVVDFSTNEGGRRPSVDVKAEKLRQAIVLGLRDYCSKVGISKVHLGLSGGVDSALVLCLAVDALGPNNVTALALPGPFSSEKSFEWAAALTKNLGVRLSNLSIVEPYKLLVKQLEESLSLSEFGVVHENLQARLRGMILMSFANAKSSLLLTTSNKSEYAVGYATLYGDMCGGLAPIGDLTKRQVYEICELYNTEHEIIPRGIIERAPSAELRPNQKDQDSLPDYDLLDKAVEKLVVDGDEAKSATDKWLMPILLKTEFKRWQAPPILKLSKHSFGRGRRFPIAHRAQE